MMRGDNFEEAEQKKKKLAIPKYYISMLQAFQSQSDFNDMLKVRLLLGTPPSFIVNALRVDHFTKLIQATTRDTSIYNSELLSDVLDLYKILMTQSLIKNRLQSDDIVTAYSHAEHFHNLVVTISEQRLSSSYLGFLLACGQFGTKIYQLPSFLASSPQIDCLTFFSCVNQFVLYQQKYNLAPHQDTLCNIMQSKLTTFFNSPKGKGTEMVANEIVAFYTHLFMRIQGGKVTQFDQFLLSRFIGDQKFAISFLALLKKYNHESTFNRWAKVLIQVGLYDQSYHLVESVLFYYISSAEKFGILDLLENQHWAANWFSKMVNTDFFVYTEMFLNDEPYSFLIFTKLLGSYPFGGQEGFIKALNIVNFDIYMRKFWDNEIVHTETMRVLKLYLNQCELGEMMDSFADLN